MKIKSWIIEVWICHKMTHCLQNTNNSNSIAHLQGREMWCHSWVQNLIDVPPQQYPSMLRDSHGILPNGIYFSCKISSLYIVMANPSNLTFLRSPDPLCYCQLNRTGQLVVTRQHVLIQANQGIFGDNLIAHFSIIWLIIWQRLVCML